MHIALWTTVAGVILAILGALYSAYGYLDIKFFKVLTESFTFGAVGGLIVGLSSGLLIVFGAIIQIFIYQGTLTDLYDGTGLLIIVVSVIVGVVFGFAVGFALSRLKEGGASLRSVSIWRRWSFLALMFLILLCLFDLYVASMDPFGGILSSGPGIIGFLGLLFGSFVIGVITQQAGIPHTRSTVWLALGTICLEILLLLLYAIILSTFGDGVWQVFSPNPTLNIAIPGFIFSYLIGSRLHEIKIIGHLMPHTTGNSQGPKRTVGSFSQKASWKRFTVWQILGCVFVISLAQLCNYLLALALPYNFAISIPILLTIGFLIAFIGGEGEKLVTRPKPRYRYRLQHNDLRPLINWSRFIHGFGVVFITCFFWNLCQSVYDNILRCLNFKDTACLTAISANAVYTLGVILVRLSQPWLTYGLILGSVIGGLYGFSPALIFTVENLSERRLGQIGLILTVLGILVAALPSLIN